MSLRELVDSLNQLDPEFTIYAKRDWSENSPAIACLAPDDSTLPAAAADMDYLLEVYLAQEVVEVWKQWSGGKVPSSSEKCAAIIYYGMNDSYVPV